MYSDRERSQLTPLKLAISQLAGVNSLTGYKVPCLGAAGLPPLAVEDVACATVAVTLDPSIGGVVDINSIIQLARNARPLHTS
jgi:hypothetical protein